MRSNKIQIVKLKDKAVYEYKYSKKWRFDKDAIKESQNQVILYITKIKSMNNGVDK